jgi:dsDNA-specific endonuclease/ATPase MutS2
MSVEPQPQEFPIEGTLDLHTFRPSEAGEVVDAFVEESRARGWQEVRIVHGKGTGALRELVHTHLRRSPHVTAFRLGDQNSGSWGATLATLKPKK